MKITVIGCGNAFSNKNLLLSIITDNNAKREVMLSIKRDSEDVANN